MHPKLRQFLLNAGLDYETPPLDIATWQAFLRLVQEDYAQRKPTPHVVPPQAEASGNQVEQRLAAERDKFKAVLASLDSGMCVFDTQARLQLLNAAAQKQLGDIKPLNSETVLRCFKVRDQWSDDPMSPPQLIQQIKDGCELKDGDAQLLRQDGSVLPVSFSLMPLINHRKVIGAVLVFQDICLHKKIEADLLAAKEAAEQASSAKSDFMTSMSHELRTPMNAILGYGDIVLEELEYAADDCNEELVEEVRASMQNIVNAGRSLLGLINGVLDLSKVESGKLEISIERVDLAKIIEECIKKHQDALTQAGITLDNQAKRAIYAVADPARLRQVLNNLLSNAIKYNRENGTITLKTEAPSITRVKILVQDTGVGMSAEQQEQIFQPFVRMSGRNLSIGTGIGLTIAKHLLEIMDGHIGVDSVLDQGSSFWVELPTGEAPRGQAESFESGRNYLLLYVEDSRTNVSLVSKLLKVRPDIALISAPSGEMGVELARLHQPDVILLDINLPGIDGFEVLERMQKIDSLKRVPVIGLSADDTPEALEKAQTAGFYEYMIKPLKKERFLELVNTVLSASVKRQGI
jgi:PAS domain S-box-containing protein